MLNIVEMTGYLLRTGTGLIRVINADGTLRATPFLDITSKISSTNSEEGFWELLSARIIKPAENFMLIIPANIAGQLTTVVEEYKVSAADSNVADVSSALTHSHSIAAI